MSSQLSDVDVFSNQPVVIDNGSGLIKAGFAGADLPKLIFPSYVGRPKHVKVMAGAAEGDYFVGEKARELRGLLKLSYPLKHGVVTDWEDMLRIWQHTYTELNIVQDQHPVLLSEAALNPMSNRGKAAEFFFDTFNSPALFIQSQPILSLYASGRTTGVVLDSGDGVTNVVPVYEGFVLPHAICRTDIAGRDVTEYLQLLLRKAGYNFHTSAEFETVKHIKETLCCVAYNIEDHEKYGPDDSVYKLPDGQVLTLRSERYQAPELLFNPSLIGSEYVGIHTSLVTAIQKCDLDIRRLMFSNIILAGGTTMFDGLGDRLLLEVKKLAPKDTKIKIWAPPERILSTWIGGSILASLATFKLMCVTKEEYKEHGVNIVYKKTF